MSEHVCDDAERRRIDGHLATCDACSRAVGAAERATLALENIDWNATARANAKAGKRTRPPDPNVFVKFAVAAALILLAVGAELGIQNRSLAQNSHVDDIALAALATSHFFYTGFVPSAPGIATAKAMYARDGAWTYVVVAGNTEGWHVYGKTADTAVEVATLHAHNDISTAFAITQRRFDALELQNTRGETVATVTLAYPKSAP